MKKLDWYVIVTLGLTIIFTVVMVWIFLVRSYIPDTLVQCFFTYVVGEFLCCAIIKTVGERQAARKEALEDRTYYEEKEKELP